MEFFEKAITPSARRLYEVFHENKRISFRGTKQQAKFHQSITGGNIREAGAGGAETVAENAAEDFKKARKKLSLSFG